MKYAAAISILFVVAGCASVPSMRVVAETECIQEVTIKTSLVSDFATGPVMGCGQRAYTGKFYMTHPRIEVPSSHIVNSGGALIIAPEFRHLYENAA
jgi:hypothetical protein